MILSIDCSTMSIIESRNICHLLSNDTTFQFHYYISVDSRFIPPDSVVFNAANYLSRYSNAKITNWRHKTVGCDRGRMFPENTRIATSRRVFFSRRKRKGRRKNTKTRPRARENVCGVNEMCFRDRPACFSPPPSVLTG